MQTPRSWKGQALFFLVLLSAYFCGPSSAQVGSTGGSTTKESLESHLGSGYTALQKEEYDVAEREFRAALLLDPTLDLRARFPLAVALFEQHKPTESRHEFELVRRTAGDQPGVLYYLGRLDLEEQNYQRAVAHLGAASDHPPFPDTAFYLGMAYLKLGENAEAQRWLEKATEVNPEDSRAEYELATVYRQEGRADDANRAFQRSKEIKAHSDKLSQLRFACGQELDQGTDGRRDSACSQLRNSRDSNTLAALGVLYGQHGQLEKALEPLKKAAEGEPQSPQMQYNLAFTYFELKDYEQAREALQVPAERWPDLFPLSSLYGKVLWHLGEMASAYAVLHHAHQLNAGDAGTTTLLYQTCLKISEQPEKDGLDREALRYLEEAAALAPTDPEPHQRMAKIYAAMGKPDRAKSETQKALVLSGSPRP